MQVVGSAGWRARRAAGIVALASVWLVTLGAVASARAATAALAELRAVHAATTAPAELRAVRAATASERTVTSVTWHGAASAGSGALSLALPLVADYGGLHRFTEAVTTPGSPLYQHYESIRWLARHFGASRRNEARVTAFLRSHGASRLRVDATGLFVVATLRTARAERLFEVRLVRVRGRSGERFLAPASRVVIPPALRGLITGVVGLDTQAIASGVASGRAAHSVPAATSRAVRAARAILAAERLGIAGVPVIRTAQSGPSSGYSPVSGTPSGCPGALSAGGFTPSQYLTAYNYGPLQTTGTTGQDERAALIEIDGFKASDITAFARCFGLTSPKINAFGVGVNNPLKPGGESTLDIEVLDAAAPGLRSVDVYESQPSATNVLQALTSPLQTTGYKPVVISASLGLCESQTLQAVGHSGIRAAEAALQEAAASGITFLAASGDFGSADCVSSNSQNAQPQPSLAVNYPASSPYATAVGGTNFVLNANNTILSQQVWNDGAAVNPVGASGGGFSTLFTRPTYQLGTVAQNQRAVPDVALLADVSPGYDVYCSAADCINPADDDPWQTVGGTSAATPLLAGGLALIDEQLRLHNLQGLGFVNPLLYAIGRNPALAPLVFDSVTTGSNDVGPFLPSSNAPLGCCTAAPGFNEATGWGGVNLDELATVALSSESPIATVAVAVSQAQRPVATKAVSATVICSAACLFAAFARVTIGQQAPFTDHASLYHLAAAGQRTVKVPFSRGQLSRLQTALANGTPVTATVTGAIVDPALNIELQSPQGHLTITR